MKKLFLLTLLVCAGIGNAMASTGKNVNDGSVFISNDLLVDMIVQAPGGVFPIRHFELISFDVGSLCGNNDGCQVNFALSSAPSIVIGSIDIITQDYQKIIASCNSVIPYNITLQNVQHGIPTATISTNQ